MSYASRPLTSSEREDWGTPPEVWRAAVSLWGKPTLDAAASDENHLCPCWFTRQDDAFALEWGHDLVWLNPPYGRALGRWVERACDQVRKYGIEVVLLVPARTDTRWWAEAWAQAVDVRFIQGRVRFLAPGGQDIDRAPFPSALLKLGPGGGERRVELLTISR